MNKKGFTLAEVLITLSIIGVVGALTIPSIMKSYEKTVFRNAFKKNFSDITQAAKLVINDNGGTIAGLGSGAGFPAYAALTAYSQYLPIVKRCGDGTSNAYSECFSDFKQMDGTSVVATNGNWWTFAILKNGASIRLGISTGNVGESIDVDVNGTKGPNVFGRDIFSMFVYGNEIKPLGPAWSYSAIQNNTTYPDTCNDSSAGTTCGDKVMKGIDY